VLVAALGVVIYASFILNPAQRGDWFPYVLVLVAESIIMAQSLLSLWTILSSGYDPRGYAFNRAQQGLYGPDADQTQLLDLDARHRQLYLDDWPVSVDVFVTTYGEDPEVVRQTLRAAQAVNGRHTTYCLDDGRSEVIRGIAAEVGVEYVVREGNAHAKAGNVNHALSRTSGDFFVILDADFVVAPEFLHETVPFFADPRVAFVQTPQVYGNLSSLISRGAGYMQTVFYRFTQPGKNRFNAAFCVGTNVIFRRAATQQIGGIYQDSKSEDVWTSLKLHERGWRSIYISTELAVGATPETIESYTKQQLRWATGGFEILFRSNPMSRARALTVDQRLQYLGTATFYLVGASPLLLLAVPPLQIYFGLTPIASDTSVVVWLLYYSGFYFMQIAVALYIVGSFRWETLMLASASFPIYVQAFINAALRREKGWNVTGRKGEWVSPFTFIVPQVLVFVFLLLTSAVGMWQDWLAGTVTVAVIWNLLNTAVLGAFVLTAIREARRSRRESKAPVRTSEPRQFGHDDGLGLPSQRVMDREGTVAPSVGTVASRGRRPVPASPPGLSSPIGVAVPRPVATPPRPGMSSPARGPAGHRTQHQPPGSPASPAHSMSPSVPAPRSVPGPQGIPEPRPASDRAEERTPGTPFLPTQWPSQSASPSHRPTAGRATPGIQQPVPPRRHAAPDRRHGTSCRRPGDDR
ncbi:MAG TPA: glycosyltransferase family 2 protein, partial [Thermomicrobiales bacterium]|nr:glycosyltransferase family 2 protein [Thermomicrobiales bacterium]